MESEDKGTGTIMLRNFFSFLGVAFIALAIFCAAFIGRLGAELHDQGPAYEKLAVDITRRLSETWSVTDIKEHYAMAVAFRMSGPAAQASLDKLKPLGQLRYVSDVTCRTRWSRDTLQSLESPSSAAEALAELLSKTVRITFVAKFANGFADVSVELKGEGNEMKLWHLQIDSRDMAPAKPRPLPRQRKVSHA